MSGLLIKIPFLRPHPLTQTFHITSTFISVTDIHPIPFHSADIYVVIQGTIYWQRYATLFKRSNDDFLFLAYFILGHIVTKKRFFGGEWSYFLGALTFRGKNCVTKRSLTFEGVLLSREY